MLHKVDMNRRLLALTFLALSLVVLAQVWFALVLVIIRHTFFDHLCKIDIADLLGSYRYVIRLCKECRRVVVKM